jgi:hypothetical protein
MSEVPSGSWDSPHPENFARSAGRQDRAPGETASGEVADPDPAEVHTWYTTGMELLGTSDMVCRPTFRPAMAPISASASS